MHSKKSFRGPEKYYNCSKLRFGSQHIFPKFSIRWFLRSLITNLKSVLKTPGNKMADPRRPTSFWRKSTDLPQILYGGILKVADYESEVGFWKFLNTRWRIQDGGQDFWKILLLPYYVSARSKLYTDYEFSFFDISEKPSLSKIIAKNVLFAVTRYFF